MRRAGVAGLVLVAGAAIAGAEPAKMAVTAEGGAEEDSNVTRETAPSLRIAVPVARLGAKLTGTGRLARGGYALAVGALSQTVLSGKEGVSPENTVLLLGDVRWMRPLGQRAVSAGFGLLASDALPTTDSIGARTFRMLGADGLLALRGDEDRTLTVALGGRDFAYKPDRRYDWRGPTASVRLDLTLWQRDEGARSLELSARFELEARAYDSVANASACPEDAPPREECYTGTSLRRHDRSQRGGLELTWTGRFVAAAGYRLWVIDSNSYGQSLVRHELTLSATRDLPWRLYGSVLATLVLDNYPDGLPIERDLVTQPFTTLDDENRSKLRVRIARQVAKAWAIESHAAILRDLRSELGTEYQRATLYIGAIYNR
jgi:hypothetical protein